MIGSTLTIASGVLDLVLAVSFGVAALGPVETAAALAVLLFGVSGIVAVRALSGAPAMPGPTSPSEAAPRYRNAA